MVANHVHAVVGEPLGDAADKFGVGTPSRNRIGDDQDPHGLIERPTDTAAPPLVAGEWETLHSVGSMSVLPQSEPLLEAVRPPEDDDAPQAVQLRVRRRLPGSRIDKFLRNRFPRFSRTLLQRLIRDGGITVNGLPTKASYEPATGDIIHVLVPPQEPSDVVPENIPIDVLYEDPWMLAINKQVGIICHPASFTQSGTLVNALAFHAEALSRGGDPYRPGIVHRLDKNTTGVMLVAKCDEAHWRLGLQFEHRTIQKTYLAIVEGELQLDADLIDQPLVAHPVVKDRFMVAGKAADPQVLKEAVTRYEVAERYAGYTLVRLHPKTGRTHQLRVHMSNIGHPMLGDTLYGGHLLSEQALTGAGSADPLIRHQSLHAWRIQFVHPIKEVPMTLEAPLPATLRAIIDLLCKHRPRRSAR